jgi:hypothetical protein
MLNIMFMCVFIVIDLDQDLLRWCKTWWNSHKPTDLNQTQATNSLIVHPSNQSDLKTEEQFADQSTKNIRR